MRSFLLLTSTLGAVVGAVLPYVPVSLFDYRISKPVLIVAGPIICILCIMLTLLGEPRLDTRSKLLAVCGVISVLPLIWTGIIFLLWKLFGFAP